MPVVYSDFSFYLRVNVKKNERSIRIRSNLFKFEALSFHTDYDFALRNAFKNIFPNVTLKGCWFH